MQCEEKYGIVEIIETEGIVYTADTACVWCYLEIFSEWKGVHVNAVYKKSILKRNSFIKLGLNGTETILIHSSMKAIGDVEGGAETVLDAWIGVF